MLKHEVEKVGSGFSEQMLPKQCREAALRRGRTGFTAAG
jgi:hypothetical protein